MIAQLAPVETPRRTNIAHSEEPSDPTSLRVPRSLLDRIDAAAERLGTSRTNVLLYAAALYFNHEPTISRSERAFPEGEKP